MDRNLLSSIEHDACLQLIYEKLITNPEVPMFPTEEGKFFLNILNIVFSNTISFYFEYYYLQSSF